METNIIYNEDCFVGLKKIPDKSIDLIITDPPYLHTKGHGVNHKTGKSYSNGNSKFSNSELYSTKGFMMSEMSFFTEDKIQDILKEFVRICKIPNMYIFCNETQIPYYTMFAEKNGLMFSIIVWEKPLSIINKNRFSQNIEFIVRLYDYGTALNRIEGKNQLYNRVKFYKQVKTSEKIHPTQKPLGLVSELIELSSKKNDIILDAFSGSGTTAIACEKLNRRYICFEIDDNFYKIAKERIKSEKNQLKLFDL